MFRALAVFAKEGVLALLTESLGANNEQSRGTILEFKLRITNLLVQSKNRVIFSLFSSDILRIQQICDIAIEQGKKIAVIGRKVKVYATFSKEKHKVLEDFKFLNSAEILCCKSLARL